MEPPQVGESNLDVVMQILGTSWHALDAIATSRDVETAEALREAARSLHDAALKFALVAGIPDAGRPAFDAAVMALEQKLVASGAWPANPRR